MVPTSLSAVTEFYSPTLCCSQQTDTPNISCALCMRFLCVTKLSFLLNFLYMPDIYISQHHGYFSYAFEMFFAHWKHRLHCLHSSMVLTPLVADARLTESYLRFGSLYSLHDIPRDRWPFHFMLEPTVSFIPRCGRRPLCGSFHGGMRPPIWSFQYLVKDEFISWQGCQVGRRVHCRTL